MIPHRLYIGAVGQGLFRSLDHGLTFKRAADGMFVECDTRALIVDPHTPGTLYLGSEDGAFVSRNGADSWQSLNAPVQGKQIWSLALQQRRLIAGTCPSGIVYSNDLGETWTQGNTTMDPDCPRIRHTRVTSLLVDPKNTDHLWAGVEIDGIHFSSDAGQNWRRIGEGLSSADIHGLAIVDNPDGSRRILATTNRDLNRSDDNGKTWQRVGLEKWFPWNYCRGIAQRLDDPQTLLVGCGEGPPGWSGAVGISHDGGLTWQPAQMPGRANSTIWMFAMHISDPKLIYSASVSGQVYRSTDGGLTWEKLEKEFGEIRATAWEPNTI